MATCGSHHAFVAYVHGELCAATQPAESIPYYVEAIAEAARVGCNFIEGVARVSLASARSRTGDLSGAAEGFAHLIDFWRRTGQTTQLWTTARNAAELLSRVDRPQTAALLLICADIAPGTAAVDPEIARFSGRAFIRCRTWSNPRSCRTCVPRRRGWFHRRARRAVAELRETA